VTDVDIRAAAAPRSDQLNYEDLINDTKTVTVADVRAGSKEQPVEVHLTGLNGKPYKPCKSMLRVLIAAWGDKGKEWIGRSMTLFGDPDVRFGGVAVGGIRISHVSEISQPLSVLLSTSRGKRKPYVVQPLKTPPPAESDPALDALLKKMRAAKSTDELSELVADYDMDALTESQRETARQAYTSLRAKLEQ